MCIDKQARIKEELRGSTAPDLDKEEVCNSQESLNSLQESDFPTEERVEGSLSRIVSR
jgi:hypothetical protein